MPTEVEAAREARILEGDLERQKLGRLTLYDVPREAKPRSAPPPPRAVHKAPARRGPTAGARASRQSRQRELEGRRRELFRACLAQLPSVPVRQFASAVGLLYRDLVALNAEYGAVEPPAPEAPRARVRPSAPRVARAPPRPQADARAPLHAADDNPFRGEWECALGDSPPGTPQPQQLLPLVVATATREAPRAHAASPRAGGVEGRWYTLERSDQPTESNFKGVHKTKHGTWQAQIWDQHHSTRKKAGGGGLRSVGNYPTARQAALAIAIAKQHKTFARREILALMNDIHEAQIFEDRPLLRLA